MHMYNVSTPKIDMNLTNCLMVQISLLAQDNHIRDTCMCMYYTKYTCTCNN